MPIYYLEVNILCIIILIAVFDKFKEENLSTASSSYFKKLIGSTIFFSFFDILAGILRGTMYKFSRPLLFISNSLYLLFGTLISYYYTSYIINKIGSNNFNKQKKLLIIPVTIIEILLVINLFTGIFFTINQNNLYSRSKFIWFYIIITFLYAFITLSFLIYNYFKYKNDTYNKKEVTRLFLFTIIIIISTIVQSFNYGVTLCQVGFTIAILMIYLNIQRNNGNIDELTGIDNRRAFNRNASRIFDGDKMMFLMLMDANDFKSINDKYGHITGDNALIEIANILKRAIQKSSKDYFLARYGGDEFIIVGEITTENDIKALIKNIELEEKIFNEISSNPYNISLSIGYSIKNDNHIEIEDLIKDADIKMYNKKDIMKKKKK